MDRKACETPFMAGTLCTDRPGHEGPHSAYCQECTGDWLADTCTCPGHCDECGAEVERSFYTCAECADFDEAWAALQVEPSKADMEYVRQSLGVTEH